MKANTETKEIKIALIQRGISQIEIARELGVSHAVVCAEINGKRKSARVREYILARLGLARKKRPVR
jgi:predicted transcriptional regulator